MQTMQRGEECAGDAERGRTQTSETAEIRADDVERGGCDVGNGLDSGRVDVVVDDRATRMQTDNLNLETTTTHSTGCCSGTQIGNINDRQSQLQNWPWHWGVSKRPDHAGHQDNTINNKYCCCCRNQRA